MTPWPSLQPLQDEVVRYLVRTRDCWWTAKRIGAVLPHAAEAIETVLQLSWQKGALRRKRGIGGAYEYQARFGETA